MPLPIDPSFATRGLEWQIEAPAAQPQQQQGGGFGGALGKAVSGLEQSQTDAAAASQSLADGTAADPTNVVMAVERARLEMQMASQVRTKAVEAFQDIFHTQV
ncbi:MAG: flagellar hook-basal body complex protein FliE [Thermoleophilaceae bacterium]